MAKNDKTKNQEITSASVLAFERKLAVSDGMLFGTNWQNRYTAFQPIKVVEKSVRGTISNRLSNKTNDAAKLNASIEHPNPQTVDAASLSWNQDTLKLKFTLKVLSGAGDPSACNDIEHFHRIQKMYEGYVKDTEFKELAHRYAVNLANARFLWRNRVGAEKLEVKITVPEDEETWTFNGYNVPIRHFETADTMSNEEKQGLEKLADKIAQALCGNRSYLFLEVEAYALLGKGQEVYPSEELIMEKGKSSKSKVLYQVDGVAAMHSQKLGNAIRTIDTWYSGAEAQGPIAVDAYGAVTTLGRAYRPPKEGKDFYTLFDRWSSGVELENLDDKHYVMAMLVRGGVFGVSSKEKD